MVNSTTGNGFDRWDVDDLVANQESIRLVGHLRRFARVLFLATSYPTERMGIYQTISCCVVGGCNLRRGCTERGIGSGSVHRFRSVEVLVVSI